MARTPGVLHKAPLVRLCASPSQQILADIGARLGGAGHADFHPGFQRGVDARPNTIAEHCPVLDAAGINPAAMDHRDVIAAVVAVVFGAGTGPQRDISADDRVGNIALAGDVGVVVDDRVFDLGAVAYNAIRAD